MAAGELSVKITADLTDIKGKLAELEATVQNSLGKSVPEASEKAGTGMRAMGKVLREVTPLLGAEASGIARHLAGIGNAVDLLINRSQGLSFELKTGLAVAVAAAGYNLGVWLGEKLVNAIDNVDGLTEAIRNHNAAVKPLSKIMGEWNDSVTKYQASMANLELLYATGASEAELYSAKLAALRTAAQATFEALQKLKAEEPNSTIKKPILRPEGEPPPLDSPAGKTYTDVPNPDSRWKQADEAVRKSLADQIEEINRVEDARQKQQQRDIDAANLEVANADRIKQANEDLINDAVEAAKREQQIAEQTADQNRKAMQQAMKDEQRALDEKLKHEKELQAAKITTGSVAKRVAEQDRARWESFHSWVASLQLTSAKMLSGIQNIASTVTSSIGNALSSIVVYGEDAAQVLDQLWKSLLSNIINYFVELLVQQAMFYVTGGILGRNAAIAEIGVNAARGAASASAAAYNSMPWPISIGVAFAAAAIASAAILACAGGLAAGGITLGPTIALIGEAGTEVVMPLDKLDSLLTRGRGNITFITELDGKALTRAVVPNIPGVLRSQGIRGI